MFLFEEGLGPTNFNVQGLNNFFCLSIHLFARGRHGRFIGGGSWSNFIK